MTRIIEQANNPERFRENIKSLMRTPSPMPEGWDLVFTFDVKYKTPEMYKPTKVGIRVDGASFVKQLFADGKLDSETFETIFAIAGRNIADHISDKFSLFAEEYEELTDGDDDVTLQEQTD